VAYPQEDWLRIIAVAVAIRSEVEIVDTPDWFQLSGAHSAVVKAEELIGYIIAQVNALPLPDDAVTFRNDIALVVRERLTGQPAAPLTFDGHIAGILIEVNYYGTAYPDSFVLRVGRSVGTG
jgi:hypothetical protein